MAETKSLQPGVYVVGTVVDVEEREVTIKGEQKVFHRVWVSSGRDTAQTEGLDDGYRVGQSVFLRVNPKPGYRGGVEYSRIARAGAVVPEAPAAAS